ncbi:MAG TPA: hypothetical protein VK184_10915 [Nostocaceae cyanobacterium]|nr:hypothetical protein [Nostocaceae cyanobacterium]
MEFNLILWGYIITLILYQISALMKWELRQEQLIIIFGIYYVYSFIRDNPKDVQQLKAIENDIQNLETIMKKLEQIFQPKKINS